MQRRKPHILYRAGRWDVLYCMDDQRANFAAFRWLINSKESA